MGTFTAQILVGQGHLYHGGITPSHYLFLSENSRPAWVLVPENVYGDSKTKVGKVVWIPTVENMLDDAVLMLAVYVFRDREIVKELTAVTQTNTFNWLEMYNLRDEQRHALYAKCRSRKYNAKIVVTVLAESTIVRQIPNLDRYNIQKEVCISACAEKIGN